MENRDPALCQAFVRAVKPALASVQNLNYELSLDADEDHCILYIPKAADDGFDISIEVLPDEIIVYAGDMHMHTDPAPPPEEAAQTLVGLLRDMLSPHMRVRAKFFGGRPYKWHLESLRKGKWVIEYTSGLILIFPWGKRSERIYQNREVKGRLDER